MPSAARKKKAPTPPPAPRVGFVSLGCPKALVDSERILTQLKVEGYAVVGTHAEADVVVVNTCGFIQSAQDESLDAIGEALAENGKVIVTGCLGAREQVIRDAHPDVLAITGPQDYEGVMRAVHAQLPPPARDHRFDLLPAPAAAAAARIPESGIKLTPRHYAYLKIAEGCNHSCTFCIIPDLRGKLRSRGIADVMREAEKLVKDGVKELLVVSQDTSAYGVDLKYRPETWREREWRTDMADLARALGEALGLDWAQQQLARFTPADQWERLLTAGLARDFEQLRIDFLSRVRGKDPEGAVAQWVERQESRLAQFRDLIDRARHEGSVSASMLAQIASQARILLNR